MNFGDVDIGVKNVGSGTSDLKTRRLGPGIWILMGPGKGFWDLTTGTCHVEFRSRKYNSRNQETGSWRMNSLAMENGDWVPVHRGMEHGNGGRATLQETLELGSW